jgi:fatty acid amide hydrolase
MSPTIDEVFPLGAAGLAREIASGRLCARDAVAVHLRRIEQVNPGLNAVVFRRFDEARREAADADERQARGEAEGPLHGVPISVKDSIFVAGTPSTGGLPSRATHRAEADSPLVARLRRAGAIVVAKTNVPQMLLYIESDNPLFGRANNPWSPERSPGGSSGGEGALVAAGGSALGLGTDLGGSIRIPAHVNGIHGLKPTSLRLPLARTFEALMTPGQEAMLPAPGPLARHVEDLALAMELLATPGHETDTTLPPVPWRSPGGIRVSDLRVGFYTDDTWFPPSPACARAVREAARALSNRGATVEEFTPPDLAEAMRIFFGLPAASGTAWARPLVGSDPVDPRLRELLQAAELPHWAARLLASILDLAGQPRRARVVRCLGRRSSAAYTALVADRAAWRDRFLAPTGPGRFDVWLSPPSPTPALTHGASRHLLGAASYTMLWNLLGWPAGVVAATRVRPDEQGGRPRSRDPVEQAAREVDAGSAGLPVGVQVAARPWREDIVLSVMAALEQDFRACPDYPARPPL